MKGKMMNCKTGQTTGQMDRLLWNRNEAAKRLGIGLRTIDSLIAAGKLQVIRIGASVRITEDALLDFIAAQQTN